MNHVQISRKYYFSAGEDSPFSKWGSGADWEIEVTLKGPIEKKSGLVVNLLDLDEILSPCLLKVDKKHLNKEIEYFSSREVTPSNVAEFFFKEIKAQIESLWSQKKQLQLLNVKASKPVLNEWGFYGQTN